MQSSEDTGERETSLWKRNCTTNSLNIHVIFFSLSPADDGEVSLREKEKKVRPFSMLDSVDQSAGPAPCGALRKNQSSEDILRDAQVRQRRSQ